MAALALIVAGLLAGCGGDRVQGQAASSPAASRPPTYTATSPVPPAAPARPATATSASTLPLLPSPTATARPSPLPPPAATASPTLPALVVPAGAPTAPAGEVLPLSLGWRFDANGHLTAGAVSTSGQRPTVFMATLGRTVYAVGPDGGLEWKARLPGPIYALAVPAGGGVAAAGDEGITLLDDRGKQVWHRDLGSRVTALAAADEGGLLAGGWDQHLSSLAADGTIRWQARMAGPVTAVLWLPGPGLAVAAAASGQVQAFDRAGTPVWQSQYGAAVTTLAPLDAQAILAGLQDGRLVASEAATGLIRFELRAPGPGAPVWQAADLNADGRQEAAAGLPNPPQLALVTADGRVAWRVALPAPPNSVQVADWQGAPTIVAGLSDGQVQAFDGEGRLRGSVQAGLGVWQLVPARDRMVALADVAAWEIGPGSGTAERPWLGPPSLLPLDAEPGFPPAAVGDAEPGADLVFLGDVVPGRSMEAQLARCGPAYPWQGLGPLLRQADLAVANLECVLSTQGRPMNKAYVIRAHPTSGQTLVEAGIDLVSLANNHALDYGQVGLDETRATLDGLRIAAVGAGRSPEEAARPAFLTLNGVRVAVLAYAGAYWNGSADVPATGNVAWAEPQRIQADVGAVRDKADVVVVLLHAGKEYARVPSESQVAAAHAAIDAGADLVVGHHPHVTQTVEHYKQGLIVYSLGDALFDIPRQAAMQGDLLRVHVSRRGLEEAELWPFWIEDAFRPRLLDDGMGAPRFEVIYRRP